MTTTKHTPLNLISTTGIICTAGRLKQDAHGQWTLNNALANVRLKWSCDQPDDMGEGHLLRVQGQWDGQILNVLEVLHQAIPQTVADPSAQATQTPADATAHIARAKLNHQIRRFFDQRAFLEVQTPCWIPEPGTDMYLDPFKCFFTPEAIETRETNKPTVKSVILGYLQTSPEFMMKRLLVDGHERIYQLTRAWRNGEVTPLHQPEFTMLEWYRAWSPMEEIMDDVEQLVRQTLDSQAVLSDRQIDIQAPFSRITMQELVQRSCGFDILAHMNLDALKTACAKHVPQLNTAVEEWDELFFELQVEVLDPYLETLGAVFVTHWPRPLAVLARADEDDPRVAMRFELYLGGLELANGFDELTDPDEQRQRFKEDVRRRRKQRLPFLPMPSRFLNALERGMPPSAGVALGVDRLLMLAMGAKTIDVVSPFGLRRDEETAHIVWG